MIDIDTSTFLIKMTRGDNETIEFGCLDSNEDEYLPGDGDVLTFAVGKRRNKDPIFQKKNVFGEFTAVELTAEEFAEDKTKYFTESGGVYTRCASDATYVPGEDYYTSLFWDIEIEPEDTAEMKSNTYVWDLQLETNGEITTIIGETDTLDPKFVIWGEVSQ